MPQEAQASLQALGEARRPGAVSPSERDRETAVHVVTVVDVACAHGASVSLFKHDFLLRAERFQDGIEVCAGPLQRLTQTVDADPVGALGKTARGAPELVPQGGSVDEAGGVFVHLEPLAQRLAHDGIAGGLEPARGFPPVKIAIEALDQFIGEADAEDTRTLLLFTRHDVFLWKEKALQYVIQESITQRAQSAKHPVWDPGTAGRLQSPLMARMSWPGLSRAPVTPPLVLSAPQPLPHVVPPEQHRGVHQQRGEEQPQHQADQQIFQP